MGQNIAELQSGGVVLRTVGAGTRAGFAKPTRAFALSTADRSGERDYVVLTREEAVKVALAVLKDELADKGEPDTLLRKVAGRLGVDLGGLLEFEG